MDIVFQDSSSKLEQPSVVPRLVLGRGKDSLGNILWQLQECVQLQSNCRNGDYDIIHLMCMWEQGKKLERSIQTSAKVLLCLHY